MLHQRMVMDKVDHKESNLVGILQYQFLCFVFKGVGSLFTQQPSHNRFNAIATEIYPIMKNEFNNNTERAV